MGKFVRLKKSGRVIYIPDEDEKRERKESKTISREEAIKRLEQKYKLMRTQDIENLQTTLFNRGVSSKKGSIKREEYLIAMKELEERRKGKSKGRVKDLWEDLHHRESR